MSRKQGLITQVVVSLAILVAVLFVCLAVPNGERDRVSPRPSAVSHEGMGKRKDESMNQPGDRTGELRVAPDLFQGYGPVLGPSAYRAAASLNSEQQAIVVEDLVADANSLRRQTSDPAVRAALRAYHEAWQREIARELERDLPPSEKYSLENMQRMLALIGD